MYFYPADIYYLILVVPALVVSFAAQMYVNSAFKKYNKMYVHENAKNLTRRILDENGLYGRKRVYSAKDKRRMHRILKRYNARHEHALNFYALDKIRNDLPSDFGLCFSFLFLNTRRAHLRFSNCPDMKRVTHARAKARIR